MIKNILVVNVNWLGDVIFSAPVFRALKDNYPQAKIVCMAHPRVTPILAHIKEIDEVIAFDEDDGARFWIGKFVFALRLRARKFDIAFLLRRSSSRALILRLAGIPIRVGAVDNKPLHFLTHPVLPDSRLKHRRDQYLSILESYGLKINDRRCALSVDNQIKEEVDVILRENGITPNERLIVIHPGGNWDLKRWPRERYSTLIDHLSNDVYKIVISGGQDDIELAQRIVSETKRGAVILAGKLKLSQLAALFVRAQLVISADSGPLHIANSVGAKVIGLFGPTRPELTSPVGIGPVTILQHDVGCNRWACYYEQCPDNVCMKSISVNDVVEAINKTSA